MFDMDEGPIGDRIKIETFNSVIFSLKLGCQTREFASAVLHKHKQKRKILQLLLQLCSSPQEIIDLNKAE